MSTQISRASRCFTFSPHQIKENDYYSPDVRIPRYVVVTAIGALCLLQLLNLFWYYLIVRIVIKCVFVFFSSFSFRWISEFDRAQCRVVTTAKAEDVRSDDEDEDDVDVGGAGGEKRGRLESEVKGNARAALPTKEGE
jgi:hypothetical protein